MSFGSSNKTTNTTTAQQSQTEPWGPAIPYLANFLKDADLGRSVLGPSGDQLDAYASLKQKAAQGMPWLDQIQNLTSDLFGTTSRAPTIDAAYTSMRDSLGGLARGDNQDILSDPRMQAMLKQVGDDAQSRITGAFAAAGRDITGNAAGQGAIGRGVTAAQLPILMQEYARQQGRSDQAIRDLMTGATSAATTGQQLDAEAMGRRAQGVNAAQSYLTARDTPENTVLNLDQQIKAMPFEDMSLLASLLLPVAGLGGQQAGTSNSTSKTKGSSFGLSLGDIGKGVAAFGSISDRRLKENVEPIGRTFDGQTIYRFRYIGETAVHIGLMAQEVEEVTPSAVTTEHGIKFVDYGRATQVAAEIAKAGV